MGLSYVYVTVKEARKSAHKKRIRFLVDSGAEYSVVPRTTLNELGIEPYRKVTIELADGSPLERDAGDLFFEYLQHEAPAPVVFGEPGDATLLGVVTLENLGLLLDPLKRRITPRASLRG